MRTSRFFLYLCVAGCLLGTACEPHWDFGSVNPEPQIVVEGWIEQGAFPVVCLSQTLSLAQTADSIDLSDIPIRWAKVTVSDGTETEVLTGRVNENYTFSYIYTGSKIRGQAGKTYSLKIEYSGRVATAETFIPEPVSLTNIEVRRCEGIDSLIQIKDAIAPAFPLSRL